jgi:hypothetical protein
MTLVSRLQSFARPMVDTLNLGYGLPSSPIEPHQPRIPGRIAHFFHSRRLRQIGQHIGQPAPKGIEVVGLLEVAQNLLDALAV